MHHVALLNQRDVRLANRPNIDFKLHAHSLEIGDLLVHATKLVAAVFQNHLGFLLRIIDDIK